MATVINGNKLEKSGWNPPPTTTSMCSPQSLSLNVSKDLLTLSPFKWIGNVEAANVLYNELWGNHLS